jgi:hypothetical protein
VGPRLNDSLYSHGNDYHGWCEARGQVAHAPPRPAEAVQGERVEEPPATQEPYTPSGPEPYTLPGPENGSTGEMPIDSSTGLRYRQATRRVSYEEPRPMNRRPPQRTTLTQSMRAAGGGPVDSPMPSRTLAKPPRTRLFSR